MSYLTGGKSGIIRKNWALLLLPAAIPPHTLSFLFLTQPEERTSKEAGRKETLSEITIQWESGDRSYRPADNISEDENDGEDEQTTYASVVEELFQLRLNFLTIYHLNNVQINQGYCAFIYNTNRTGNSYPANHHRSSS